MNCRTVKAAITDYLDATLDHLRRLALEAHLAECTGCRSELARVRRVGDLLAADAMCIDVPETLRRKNIVNFLDLKRREQVVQLSSSGQTTTQSVRVATRVRPHIEVVKTGPAGSGAMRSRGWSRKTAIRLATAAVLLAVCLAGWRLVAPSVPVGFDEPTGFSEMADLAEAVRPEHTLDLAPTVASLSDRYAVGGTADVQGLAAAWSVRLGLAQADTLGAAQRVRRFLNVSASTGFAPRFGGAELTSMLALPCAQAAESPYADVAPTGWPRADDPPERVLMKVQVLTDGKLAKVDRCRALLWAVHALLARGNRDTAGRQWQAIVDAGVPSEIQPQVDAAQVRLRYAEALESRRNAVLKELAGCSDAARLAELRLQQVDLAILAADYREAIECIGRYAESMPETARADLLLQAAQCHAQLGQVLELRILASRLAALPTATDRQRAASALMQAVSWDIGIDRRPGLAAPVYRTLMIDHADGRPVLRAAAALRLCELYRQLKDREALKELVLSLSSDTSLPEAVRNHLVDNARGALLEK